MRNASREEVVRRFSKAMGQPTEVSNPTSALLEFRYKLLLEEVAEVGEEIAYAMAESNFKSGVPHKVKVRLLKELADVQYVLSGMAVTLDLPLEEAFLRVHESNMSKLDDTGHPVYHASGKVLKGKNYMAPYLDDLVAGNDE